MTTGSEKISWSPLSDNDAREVGMLVRSAVLLVAPRRPQEVSASLDLRVDLGYSSISLVELACIMESVLGLPEMTLEVAVRIETVGDLEHTISELITQEQIPVGAEKLQQARAALQAIAVGANVQSDRS